MQPPLHSPAIFVATGLVACIALGYLLGEIIYHFAKCYTFENRGTENENVDAEAGVVDMVVAERERIREARKERLKEGSRKLSLMPIVRYDRDDYTSCSRECAICLEDFEEGDVCRVVTGCNHAFHALCVDKWLKMQQRCPVCRANI